MEEQQKFSSDECFICFISDCPHYIQWNLITILKYKHIIAPHVLSTSIFTRIVPTNSVVLVSKSAQHCLCNSGKDRCSWYIWVCTLESYFFYFLRRYRMLFAHLSNIAFSCSLMDWFLTPCLLNLNEYHLN